MPKPLRGRTIFVMVGALAALQWTLTAQSPSPAAKRPLSYDVVDYWKSIQGTRLSDDGQWLAYATTAQGDDGEVIVRNLRSGQEYKQPRGTAPAFTPDARFRSEEHTSELQSLRHLVCRLLLEKKKEDKQIRRFRWAPPAASAEELGTTTKGAFLRTGRSTARSLERIVVEVDMTPVAVVRVVPR